MSQMDTKSRPTCMTLSNLGVNMESMPTAAHPSEEGMTIHLSKLLLPYMYGKSTFGNKYFLVFRGSLIAQN